MVCYGSSTFVVQTDKESSASIRGKDGDVNDKKGM